jgi:hypothetical protein
MIKNVIVLSFMIIMIINMSACGTKTIHRTVKVISKRRIIKPRKISHLECVKELLHMDVNSDRANNICISIFRKEHK